MTERRYIHLSSNQRTGGTNESPAYFLSRPLNIQTLGVIGTRTRIKLSLLNCTIPFSFYSMPEGRNKIYYGSTDQAIDGFVEFPAGNYNLIEFVAEVEKLFKDNTPYPLKVEYKFTSNRLRYSSSVPFYLYVENDSPFYQLGLDVGQNYPITSTGITSTNSINLLPVSSVYVRLISSLIINQQESGNDSGFSDILAKVPITDNSFRELFFEPRNVLEVVCLADVINTIQLQLTDQNRNILNLHNLPWECTLSVEYEIDYIEDDVNEN